MLFGLLVVGEKYIPYVFFENMNAFQILNKVVLVTPFACILALLKAINIFCPLLICLVVASTAVPVASSAIE